jgi:putative hydrolase of the HAD superfamily
MSDLPRPVAVSLDVAGTLLHPHPSVGRIYSRVAREHGHAVDPADLDRRFAPALAALGRDGSPRERWDEVVDRTFGHGLPRSALPAVQEGCWHAFAQPGAWRLATGAIPALAQLRFLGLRLGLLSNADDRLLPVLEAKGLLPFADAVRLGETKPDPAAFARMAADLDVPVGALVHVGDSRSEDAAGAVAAGARALLLGEARADDPFPSVRLIPQVPKAIRDGMLATRPRGRMRRETRNLLANLRGHPEERSRSSEREVGTLDGAIDAAVRRLGIDRPIPEHAISAAWPRLLPPAVARRSSPLRILPDGKLLIHCESPVVRSEAAFHARALLGKVRELPGCRHVTSVGFVSG